MNKLKKKFLVTGGAGFIGGEVVRQLIKKGFDVRVADDLSKDTTRDLPKNIEFVKGDLTKKRVAERSFEGVNVCIHLAAKIGGIGYFHKYPATILSENNKLFSSVFEAAVKEKVERMVYVSSSMVFESTDIFPSKESDLKIIPPPITGYGFSKLVGEWYCRTFMEEFGLNYVIIRPFNAYGIYEKPEQEIGYAHVIPDLIRKIYSGQYPLELFGDGKTTRCVTHVGDFARGIIMASLSKKSLNKDFNLGSSKEIKMIDLAKLIWGLTGQERKFKVRYVEGFKHDIRRRVPSNDKARRILNWKPKKDLEKELPAIIEWVRKGL